MGATCCWPPINQLQVARRRNAEWFSRVPTASLGHRDGDNLDEMNLDKVADAPASSIDDSPLSQKSSSRVQIRLARVGSRNDRRVCVCVCKSRRPGASGHQRAATMTTSVMNARTNSKFQSWSLCSGQCHWTSNGLFPRPRREFFFASRSL